jgi:hypothetical protein
MSIKLCLPEITDKDLSLTNQEKGVNAGTVQKIGLMDTSVIVLKHYSMPLNFKAIQMRKRKCKLRFQLLLLFLNSKKYHNLLAN